MANLTAAPSGNHLPSVRSSSEKRLGILHYTSFVDFGWHGEIRKRYTDFIVHEVRRDGTVVYLTDADLGEEPKAQAVLKKTESRPAPESQPKEEVPAPEKTEPAAPPPIDVEALVSLVGPDVSKQMQDAYAVITSGGPAPPKFTIAICSDRSKRGHYHQEIRRIFSGRFETRADGESGAIIAMPAAGGGKSRRAGGNAANGNGRDNRGRNAGKLDQGAGKYMHFTLYKENKDTMEAMNFLARMLKLKSSNFGFSGTKDRRAATTQRVSVWLPGNQGLGWINSRSSYIKVGDFGRSKNPIQLGQHGGNDFVIVVKSVELIRGTDCSLSHCLRMTEMCVQSALDHIQQHGFINYFGLQRFGTHAIGTQEVGLKILSEDFEGACDAILHVEPGLASALEGAEADAMDAPYHRDEAARARAILMFQKSGDVSAALEILPRRFSAESTIIQHLGRNNASSRDFCGALCRITRGLRNLYIHAYQSLVWNWATSLRWSRHGDRVIAGDLVLVESEANPSRHRQGHDMSEDLNQEEEQFYQEARVLSAEEAASGQYTIFDIVLPVPGYDVLYPDNDIGEFYTEFMGRPENGGLDPYRMRRPQKEFSLSGHYRKIMARFTAVPQFFVRPYTDDAEQMHPTDLDDIRALQSEESKNNEQPHVSSTNQASSDTADEIGISRRRRPSPGQPQDLLEERVNDAWIEKTSEGGGGSKRVKIDPENQQNSEGAAAEEDAAASNGGDLPTAEDVTQAFNEGNSPRGSPMALDASRTTPEKASQPGRDTAQLPPIKHIKNLFKSAPDSSDESNRKNDGSKAINKTEEWRRSVPDFVESSNMEIAVVLNFRLSSSNYATMCLREMMTGTATTPSS